MNTSELCSAILAACSLLVECDRSGRADWITVAARTVTFARVRRVPIGMYDLECIEIEAFRTGKSLAEYAAERASELANTTHHPLADEIAHTADWAARRSERVIAKRAS